MKNKGILRYCYLQHFRSIHQIYRPTPLAFFVMTTKRLLDDVDILKKDKQKSEPLGTRKRNHEESGDDDMTAEVRDGSVITDQRDKKRESTASARLSYSSTSSSSSSQSTWTDLREDDVPLLEALGSTVGSEVLTCKVNEELNNALTRDINSLHRDEVTDILQNLKPSNILLGNERRSHYNNKEESPLDTSFESEHTPANTSNSSGSNSSSIHSRATRSSTTSNT